MIVTKDALLADLVRALKADHADSADQMLAVMEPALAAGSPAEGKAKKPKGKPKKLSGAIAKYAQQSADALIAAFPDRGQALAEQLRMQIALGRIARWSAANFPSLVGELAAGAKDKDIAKLEKAIGMKLTVSLEALFRWHNGAKGWSSFYDYNALCSTSGCSGHWEVMHGLLPQFEEEGSGKDQKWWRDAWIPFLESGGGDNLCVDMEGTFTGKKGQVIEFWHDDGPRNVLFPDLPTWAEVYADSLEQGVWTFEEEGDTEKDEKKFAKLVTAAAKGYPKEFDSGE